MPMTHSWAEWNIRVHRHYHVLTFEERVNRREWHVRETNRQQSRKPLGWFQEDFWSANHQIYKYHFAHGAENNPALIAYTVDDDKGERDIQTQIKPGRYLKQFFGGILTEKQIAYYADMHAKYEPDKTPWDDLIVKFAATPEEIARVYIRGPTSCMAAQHAEITHPTRMYGAGDLAVAYLEREERVARSSNHKHFIVARALCWPEKKIVGRAYPTPDSWKLDGFRSHDESSKCQNVLLAKLREQGFTALVEGSVSFDGARLLRMPCDRLNDYHSSTDYFVMPYLDNNYRIGPHEEEPEKYFVMRAHTSPKVVWSGGNTSGNMHAPRPKKHCCQGCAGGYDEDPAKVVVEVYRRKLTHAEWCPSCVGNYTFTCEISGDLCALQVSAGSCYKLVRKGNAPAAVEKWRVAYREREAAREAKEREEYAKDLERRRRENREATRYHNSLGNNTAVTAAFNAPAHSFATMSGLNNQALWSLPIQPPAQRISEESTRFRARPPTDPIENPPTTPQTPESEEQ